MSPMVTPGSECSWQFRSGSQQLSVLGLCVTPGSRCLCDMSTDLVLD